MADEVAATREILSPKNRRILILYGSETGNSQDFAIDLENVCERLRFRADVLGMDAVQLRSLTEYPLVIFVISTTGQGEMPKNSRVLWKRLLSKRLPPSVFSSVRFTTFGLGDSSYRQYNWAARKLHKRLLQLGATEFYPRGEADERHEDGIDGAFLPWSISLRSHLLTEYPLPEGLSPVPEDIQLPPKIILERDSVVTEMFGRYSEQRARGLDANGLDCKAARFSHVDAVNPDQQESDLIDERGLHGTPLFARLSERTAIEISGERSGNILDRHNILKDDAKKYQLADCAASTHLPADDLLPIPEAWRATIERNDRMTPEDHWQDVRRLTMVVHAHSTDSKPLQDRANASNGGFKSDSDVGNPSTRSSTEDVEPLGFFNSAADSVVLYPKNFAEDVQTLVDLMAWNDVADQPFKHYTERDDGVAIEHAPTGCYPVKNSTLRQLLTNNYDITAIPKRSFFDLVRFFATDPMQKERLQEFSEARFIDEFYDYTSRPRRSILEILQDFSSIKIPYQYMPTIFPIIRGREYSIASAGEISDVGYSEEERNVELLIAVVKYKTVLRKTRRGLCSRYIESLQPGTDINISLVDRGAPFADYAAMRRPFLGIATGTGLAPIRAAFWERYSDPRHGRNVLFFGARNERADYFFKNEWPKLQVDIHTAFSRDQKEKIYVQDIIRREYKLVCQLIKYRATIMICGSAGKMPEAVRQAILDAMVNGGVAKDVASAQQYLKANNEVYEEVW